VTRGPVERVAAGVRGLLMQQTAKILKFKGKTLKTLKDVQVAELAVLADLKSGAVTAMEAREIHVQLIAMLQQFVNGETDTGYAFTLPRTRRKRRIRKSGN
jgi:hypothetical protein